MALFGLPTLLSNQNFAANAVPTLLSAAEGAIFDLLSVSETWGVFLPGTITPAVTVDSFVEGSVSRESPVSEYRIETGSFATYNKVQKSRDTPITLSKSGTDAERLEFMKWLEQNCNSTTLFDVRWPEGAFSNVTLMSYRITRKATHGAMILYAECLFKEVREVPALYYNSGQPSTDTTNAASAADVPLTPTQRVQGLVTSAQTTIQAGLGAIQSAIGNTINTVGAAIRWN